MINIAENYCGIPTDGVVYRINDYNEATRRGRTAHHFSGSLAWKPQYEEYCTYLRSIDYDVSRMGLLTPVAVFDPVIIDGTEVSRDQLQVGDLVFFNNTSNGGVGHVGIYIGDNTIVHAANSRRGVTTDTIASGYYNNYYYTARRIAN